MESHISPSVNIRHANSSTESHTKSPYMMRHKAASRQWALRHHLLLAIFLLAAVLLQAQRPLIDHGRCHYTIHITDPGDRVMQLAAAELDTYLHRIAHDSATAQASDNPVAIVIGPSEHYDSLLWQEVARLHDDGFLVYSDGHSLYLRGRNATGCLYAVYDFLEQYLGCRFLTPEAEEVPTRSHYTLPSIHRLSNPAFAYREVLYYYPNHSTAYCHKHRLHNRSDMNRQWGMFVHTFRHLVPADRYFGQHPEWFSECDGQRVRDGQLCLTNPEVLDILCHNLDSMMHVHPDKRIWSVSNNDNYNVCHCPACRRADSLYGGPSGTLLHFINQVARRFPDKVISTLGYQFTRRPPYQHCPQPQRPDSNVSIMFCSIECGRQHPIASDPGEQSFRDDMQGWAALTHNIFMWDYVVQFRNFWNPFPNLHVLQPNLKYFSDHGVREMFEQGSGADNLTSWMELRTYLIAKLLWDPYLDADSLVHDFCSHYYGPAAPWVEQYYRQSCRLVSQSSQRLDIYGYPIDGVGSYLAPDQLPLYRRLFDQAYLAAGSDSAIVRRVRYLELSLDYAELSLSMSHVHSSLSFFDTLDGTILPRPSMVAMADRFLSDCNRFGIRYLHEMGGAVEEFRAEIDNYIRKSSPSLSTHRPVHLALPYDRRYPASTGIPTTTDSLDGRALTDGVAGILDYRHHWLGFYGIPLDATIDLGSVQPVSHVSIDCYFFPLSWIFLPDTVTFCLSDDGLHWREVALLRGENPAVLAVPNIHTFQADMAAQTARYVRVTATPLPSIPEWHRAVGNPCWIFADEVMVW